MLNNSEQIQAMLEAMRQQETACAAQVQAAQEQLLMTRGAVQVLEHLLTKIEGEGDSLPPVVEEAVNNEQC
jgi:hypothetical protein